MKLCTLELEKVLTVTLAMGLDSQLKSLVKYLASSITLWGFNVDRCADNCVQVQY